MERIHLLFKVGILLCVLCLTKNAQACSPAAQITGWQNVVLPNDFVNLQGPLGSRGYQWLVDGVLRGTNQNFSYQSATAGSFSIQLIVDNDSCHDSSSVHLLRVGGCGAYDQNQRMIWALEDSIILDFSGASPAISLGGNMHGLISFGSSFLESCTSICNDVGELQFSSNGEEIWDRNHQVMPNGNNMLGHYSTNQGSLAFPDPGDDSTYYFFTLDTGLPAIQDGLRYSRIDMRLNNGLGDVIPTAKNVRVALTYNESMDGIYHANGKDVWVVAAIRPFSQTAIVELKSFLITENGLSGPVAAFPVSINNVWRIPSLLKFSHDGQWLIAGDLLFQFNTQNGQFQYYMDLDPVFPGLPHGLEFSPDNTKMYVSFFGGPIIQLDLSNPAPVSILNSVVTLFAGGMPNSAIPAKMELGPNDKIYVVNRNNSFLGEIASPDQPGLACNYQIMAIPYPPTYGRKSFALPTYISGRYTNDRMQIAGSDTTPCMGEPINFWSLCTTGTYVFSYEVNGDTLYPQKGDSLLRYVPLQAGPLTVKAHLENACGDYYYTLQLDVQPFPQVDLGPDLQICDDSVILDMSHILGQRFLWSTGSQQDRLQITQAGNYWLQLTDSLYGCMAADSIYILSPPPVINLDLGPDTVLCEGESVLLQTTRQGESMQWQDGSQGTMFTVNQSGIYWIEVIDTCGHIFRDSIIVQVQPLPQRDLVDSLFFCPGENVSVDVQSAGFSAYRWEDGPQGSLRTFSVAGTYYIEAEDVWGCIARDTLEVIRFPDPPSILLSDTDSICSGERVEIDASTPGLDFFVWADGSAGAVRSFDQSGIFRLMATDVNGCQTVDSIAVRWYEPIPIFLPPDTIACRQEPIVLDVKSDSFLTYVWQDGYREAIRAIDSAGRYTLTVEDIHHCFSSASIRIQIASCRPQVFMPSAFSPNADAVNDFFGPSFHQGIIRYELNIFSRWGPKIYGSTDPFPGWDGNYQGESCPEGVYIYTLSYVTDVQTVSHLQGTITLIR